MINGLKVLGLITARGGSKRIKNKNLLEVNDRPLIYWSIRAGLESKYVDKVLVSSDCSDILEVSKASGSSTIKRPLEFATDEAPSYLAIEHALNQTTGYDVLVLLQPTSPLRTSKHIDEALEHFVNTSADSVISVTETECPTAWCNTIPDSNDLSGFIRESNKGKRSQDFETEYRVNGAIYISKVKRYLEEKDFFMDSDTYAFKMNRLDSVDIDTIDDLNYAEFLLQNSLHGG